MEPVAAAGIALSVTSLTIQIFSGSYQLFLEAEEMPEAYGYLRVRLRLEQERLLRWGEKIGLAEALLESPSRALQLNRNLIFDILLEIQAVFKKTIKIQSKFDVLGPERSLPHPASASSEPSFLKKALNAYKKLPQAPKRLHWAIIKHEEFEGSVEKLIGLNDAIEGLLELGAIEELLKVQRQTYMTVLQLNSKVDDLKQISEAMQLRGSAMATVDSTTVEIDAIDLIRQKDNQVLADLATFKAEQTIIVKERVDLRPLPVASLKLQAQKSSRSEGLLNDTHIWVEWKEYDEENENPQWKVIIEQRVKALVALLTSPKKSPHFNVPHCLGHASSMSALTTLYSILASHEKPSLTERVQLALTIARSITYLHSVNWLHKSLRSDNILFFRRRGPYLRPRFYASALVSGFEYSRADLVGEDTELVPEHSEHNIYRHPETLASVHIRSKKSYDIYSLGIILLEIAYWRRIKDIVELPDEERQARRVIRGLRQTLLQQDQVTRLEGSVGEQYTQAVVACLKGVIQQDSDEERPSVGVEIQKAFHASVVGRLGSIRT